MRLSLEICLLSHGSAFLDHDLLHGSFLDSGLLGDLLSGGLFHELLLFLDGAAGAELLK